ncbi:GTP cyclohydrolase II [Microbacterium lacticum]|uniref:GTP cyclohydrolase II n=1 Tax=Microbacterium lacticum TaxID=33885 RepID=UPI003A86A93C
MSPSATPGLSTIPEALNALRAGRPVIVADDENRENEGDIIMSAELATPEWLAWTIRWSSGFICAPMPAEWADRLDLPPMVAVNEDVRGTAYTVSVDAADKVSTGISATDRSHTLNVLADPASTPSAVIRPGHILPLRAVDGGVRERAGHTEAGVELMKLAGLQPVAAIGEVVAEDGSMMRLPGLIEMGAREGIPVITIEQLIAHLDDTAPIASAGDGETAPHGARRRVSLRAEAQVPTSHGTFRFLAYKDRVTGTDHIAVVSGDLHSGADGSEAPLVRVHSECLTGEAFGSLKCECGPQLDAALDAIATGGGVVVYMRGHEGRGIGLINKLRAYSLQERGLDTVDANLALGLPADARDYAAAAGILGDLGVEKVRLLTNNTDKVNQLRALGLDIVEQVPLLVGVGPNNHQYLETKRDRMGHIIGTDELEAALAHGAEPTPATTDTDTTTDTVTKEHA